MGYDNYRFWHYHPPDRPKDHIPCEEPEIKEVLREMKEVMLKSYYLTQMNTDFH